jgi:hypothetical protein
LSKRAALQRLALERPDTPEYYAAYTRYHLSEGAFAGPTAGEAAAPVAKTWTGYAPMWG